MSRRGALLACALLLWSVGAVSSLRPYEGDGACLSCHQGDLPVLPSKPCMSCHYGSMDFLDGHGASTLRPETASLAALGGGGLLLLIGIAGLVLVRKRALPAACLAAVTVVAAVQSPPATEKAAWHGAFLAARGSACDLFARFAPAGDAFLFARRGPDTDGNAEVDLRDDQALFLWRCAWKFPRRITPWNLDFGAAMAAWSPDGRKIAVPCPLADTDRDGRVGRGDRYGLRLYDSEGRPLGKTSIPGQDCLSPVFSGEGERVDFIAGGAIYEWNWATGAVRKIREASEGTFPRMAGWPGFLPGPVFWEGRDYTRLPRDREGEYVFPENSPVEIAGSSRIIEGKPIRRFKVSVGGNRLFYMAQPPGGNVGLVSWDGNREEQWSSPDRWLYALAPTSLGGCWCWSSDSQGGEAFLEWYGGPGEASSTRLLAAPSLLGLAARDDGTALVTCRRAEDEANRLGVSGRGGTRWIASARGAWFRPTAGGSAIAAVRVVEDTDGDGDLTPLDDGELWVSWEGP